MFSNIYLVISVFLLSFLDIVLKSISACSFLVNGYSIPKIDEQVWRLKNW